MNGLISYLIQHNGAGAWPFQSCQFSQLLCPEFFLLLHHNTSALQVLKSVESNGEWRKKACKIEQTCHTDLHMLLEHKLKKKFHYKKRHLLNIFLKSKKKIIRDLQSASSKQSKHSTSTRANHCFSNWFQNWASCNYESWEHNRARVNQHPQVHHDGWTVRCIHTWC